MPNFFLIFVVPSLIFVFNGKGINAEDQDAFGLFRYTLGNIGYEDYSTVEARCTSGSYAYNDTCIHFGGNEISIEEASSVLTAMEFLQVAVFFLGVFYIHRKVFSVTGKTGKTTTSLSSFAIEVRNIPPDTSDTDLIEHFSHLYRLDEQDWRKRPPVEDVRPVVDTSITGDKKTKGTWIAECILHKAIGSFISSFKDKQHLMEKLYRQRAKMKMFAENTCHAKGHNLKAYLDAEKKMIEAGTQLDRLTERTVKKKKLRLVEHAGESNLDLEAQASGIKTSKAGMKKSVSTMSNVSNASSIYYNIDAHAVSAYITFEYSESRARCLEDYSRYQSFPYSLFYPKELYFKNRRIVVTPAPEPDQILWENLEISWAKQQYLKARTFTFTAILVIICFVVILQASIYKGVFSENIPSSQICNFDIPRLYLSADTSSVPPSLSNIELTRAPASQQLQLDNLCKQTVGNTFYAVFTINGDFNQTVGSYDVSACTDFEGSPSLCPAESQNILCPCVSTTNSETCDSIECFSDPDSDKCTQFKAKDIGSCYCLDALNEILDSNGVVSTLDRIEQQRSDSYCRSFYEEYSLSVGLTYLSVLTTALVNFLLRQSMHRLAKQEAHRSTDQEHGSILTKVFQSSYITMAIIVLIAYGNSNNTPGLLLDLRIFDGPYDDFTRSWYGNIGFYLMTTFILQSYSPLTTSLLQYYVIKPLSRKYHYNSVRNRTSHTIAMQHDLNMLSVGPVFDSTVHIAQLLTLLFFSMTFAPGLPLLMPLCCLSFSMYFRIDKLLLCRFYQKPPQIGEAAIKGVVTMLPYAAIVRLAFACWMFGNVNILPDSPTNRPEDQTAYEEFLEEARDSGSTGLEGHIFRRQTFPLFIFFLFLIAMKVLAKFWKFLPIYWITSCLKIIFKELSTKKDIFHLVNEKGKVHHWDLIKLNDPQRQKVAPLTGTYFRYIKHKDEIPDTCFQMFSYAYLTQLSEAEAEDGWQIREDGDFVIKVKTWIRSSNTRKDGSLKTTFEVISDHHTSTYDVEKIPAYTVAIQGLREGASSLLEYQNSKGNVDSSMLESILKDNMQGETDIIANYNKQKEKLASEPAPRFAFDSQDMDDDTNGNIEGGGGGEMGEAFSEVKKKPVGKGRSGKNAKTALIAADLSDGNSNSHKQDRHASSNHQAVYGSDNEDEKSDGEGRGGALADDYHPPSYSGRLYAASAKEEGQKTSYYGEGQQGSPKGGSHEPAPPFDPHLDYEGIEMERQGRKKEKKPKSKKRARQQASPAPPPLVTDDSFNVGISGLV